MRIVCYSAVLSKMVEDCQLLNKVISFVFFTHKKYYLSFVKLQLNHLDYHMDYFNNVITLFLGLGIFQSIALHAGTETLGFHQK